MKSTTTISIAVHKGQSESTIVVGWPDYCPICHNYGEPQHIGVGAVVASGNLLVCFRCPRAQCSRLYISEYNWSDATKRFQIGAAVYPRSPKKEVFDPCIEIISSAFVEIYNQAAAAEVAGLDEICGVGYRKALEFLVKDYCCLKKTAQIEEIKKSLLGKCIKEFVTDVNVKACAERAVWIGNDETHYVRKWTSHDIGDLKILIKLTVNWIVNETLTERYMTEMKN